MTTTKGSALDDHKMQYEDMLLKKPTLIKKGKSYNIHVKVKRAKRPNIIKTYIKCMIETILA